MSTEAGSSLISNTLAIDTEYAYRRDELLVHDTYVRCELADVGYIVAYWLCKKTVSEI